MKPKAILKELVIEDLVDNIYAISLVKFPAIEENFLAFKSKLNFEAEDMWYYTLKKGEVGPMVIDTSHKLCVAHAMGEDLAYTKSEIQSWAKHVRKKDWGFYPDAAAWFNRFPGNGDFMDVELPMYNCRHYMKKKQIFHNNITTKMNFEVSKTKPRKIVGPVMVANHPMLRPPEELDGVNYGYVWYSNDTLEKYFKKFVNKSSATFLHEIDISDYILLTKSWLDKSNDKQWKWMCEYHILSDFIWDQVKNGSLQGFSVELVASMV